MIRSSHTGDIHWGTLPVSSFSSRGHRSGRKGSCAPQPVSQQFPPRLSSISANVCLVEYRSLPTSEDGISSTSFFHSSSLQAVNAKMLWSVHVRKNTQASEHLCPAKLQARCDICCACQSICPFIPTDSRMHRAESPRKSFQPKTVHGCVPAGAAQSRLHLLQQVH